MHSFVITEAGKFNYTKSCQFYSSYKSFSFLPKTELQSSFEVLLLFEGFLQGQISCCRPCITGNIHVIHSWFKVPSHRNRVPILAKCTTVPIKYKKITNFYSSQSTGRLRTSPCLLSALPINSENSRRWRNNHSFSQVAPLQSA